MENKTRNSNCPNLSVVITAYNVADWIAQCVESVKAQTVDNLEIIVVEDCSTDNTTEVLQLLKQKDKITRVISNEQNVGAGMSRRRGIEAAGGEYVMLLDGDDYLERNNHLELLLNCARDTDADVVSGGIKILREDGSSLAESYGNIITEGDEKITRFWKERIVFMNNKIIRRSLYDKVPYCERRYIEDTPVIIPILWYANKVAYVDAVGYVYRMHPKSLTHTATPIKEVIYKGLCWLELVGFFEKNDKHILDVMPLKQYVSNLMKMLNGMRVTEEMVKPYKEDWGRFTRQFFNVVAVTGVAFKEER